MKKYKNFGWRVVLALALLASSLALTPGVGAAKGRTGDDWIPRSDGAAQADAAAPLVAEVAAAAPDAAAPDAAAATCARVINRWNPAEEDGWWWRWRCGGGGWWWKPQPRARISAEIVGNILFIDGTRFPRRHSFTVRARRGNGGFVKIGQTRATRNGVISDAFRLPNAFRRAQRVYVCVKDNENSKTQCAWAKRAYN